MNEKKNFSNQIRIKSTRRETINVSSIWNLPEKKKEKESKHAPMARNPEGTGRLIIWLVRIHCGQVSTGKYTRSSARLAVDSVGSSAEKRDRVRSTRGSRVIRPWHREIHASRVEAIAMRPTRSRQRTLPVWYVFFESRVENSPREVEKRLGTVRRIEKKSGLPGYRCPVNRGSRRGYIYSACDRACRRRLNFKSCRSPRLTFAWKGRWVFRTVFSRDDSFGRKWGIDC